MKFICLKYLDRNTWETRAEGDRRVFLDQSLAFDQLLRESGHFFACDSVQTAGYSVGLRCSKGQLIVEDDHTLTERQWLGGLMFLEARDLNHAILLVSDHPGVRVGWFVIHPVDEGSVQ